MCILEVENQEQARSELFCGSIKSFNSRRGFGFVSCEETALRFGRDVYLSKDEAMLLAADPTVGLSAVESSATGGNDQAKVPPVKEGDVLLFQVKLSTEGFPQAVQARKIRRLRGVVQEVPSSGSEGIIVVSGDGRDEAAPQEADAAMKQLLGAEVQLCQTECGQLQLLPGDEVAFCCVSTADTDGQQLEAQLVELLSTSRAAGSALGCFSLKLPQLRHAAERIDDASPHDAPCTELHGQAFTDRICLANVPADVSMSDLMCLFGKLGGKDASVTTVDGSGFVTVTFGGPELVAKFLVQATHTISENGVTQIAHVGPSTHQRFGSAQLESELNGAPLLSEIPRDNQSINMSNLQHAVGQTLQANHEVMQPCSQQICLEAVTLQAPNASNYVCSTAPSISVPLLQIPSTSTMPGWRCMHSNILLPTGAPEMMVAADNCCSACIQWPTIVHASAYVVELLDQGTMIAQRFVRTTPEGLLSALTDLRLDGLQPSTYAACVRCVAPCGCESAPSQWSFLSIGSIAPSGVTALAPAVHMLPPSPPVDAAVVLPQMCPPPPSAPPAFPPTAPMTNTALPPIPEEAIEVVGSCSDDVLTLD